MFRQELATLMLRQAGAIEAAQTRALSQARTHRRLPHAGPVDATEL